MPDFIADLTLKRGDGADPEVFNPVPGMKNAPMPGSTAELKQVTDFDSNNYHEYITGLRDGDDLDYSFNLDMEDTQHLGLLADYENGVARNFQYILTDGSVVMTIEFTALVLRAQPATTAPGDPAGLEVKLKVSGAPTRVMS